MSRLSLNSSLANNGIPILHVNFSLAGRRLHGTTEWEMHIQIRMRGGLGYDCGYNLAVSLAQFNLV